MKKKADQKYINDEVIEFFGELMPEKAMKLDSFCGLETMKAELISPLGEDAYKQWVDAAFFSTFATWDETGDTILDDMPWEEREERLLYMLKSRPISVANECVHFTFRMSGITRSVTHQIVRHRKMAFGQQSLRVSDPIEDAIRLPDYLLNEKPDDELLFVTKEVMKEAKRLYQKLVEHGVPREQARGVLPIGITTKINATMDIRAMVEYFRARIHGIAMAEHTHLVAVMAKEFKEKQPKFYAYISSQVDGLDECIEEYLGG